jgi:hypothetical protein
MSSKNPVKKGKSGPSTKSGVVKRPVQELNPALYLHPSYGNFKKVAAALAERLKPLGLTISQLEKSVSHYVSHKYTFEVDKSLIRSLDDYQQAKVTWESFRDSFRAQKDAETIPSGALQALLFRPQDAIPEEEEEECEGESA